MLPGARRDLLRTWSTIMSVEETRAGRRAAPKWLLYSATALLLLLAAGYLARWGRGDGLDLRVYRAGIASWRSGHNPYDGSFTVYHLHFTYPPFALLVLSPLTWSPFAITQIVLWCLSIGALAGAIYVVSLRGKCRGGRRLLAWSLGWASLAVLVVEPVRSTLNYGQINTLLLGLVVVDLLVLPSRQRGLLVGVAAAIKLTPLIFLFMPLLERDWKTFGRGIASGAGTTGVMWALWPNAVQAYWTHDVFDASRVGTIAYVGNQSLYGDLHRWPLPSGGVPIVWLGLAFLTTVMGLALTRRCLAGQRRVAALLSLAFTGLLVSPISWTHHWVWVALIPPLLMVDHRQVPARSARVLLWLLFALSVLAPYWWFRTGTPSRYLGDSLSLTALIVLTAWTWAEYRHPIPDFRQRTMEIASNTSSGLTD
jgi:alpha-1,2-mannosyltransferase